MVRVREVIVVDPMLATGGRAIVVEGRYDKNTLSQVVDATILETRGFGVMKDKALLSLLRQAAEKRGLILLTDSDGAGFVIRNYLKGAIPAGQLKQAYIPDMFGKERRKAAPGKEGKLGVEGMKPEVLLEALHRAGATFEGEENPEPRGEITKADLYALGLSGGPDSSRKRLALLRALQRHAPGAEFIVHQAGAGGVAGGGGMTITRVTEERLPQAAAVYREAWRESHRDLCTPEFLERRDCGAYLEQQMAAGKRLYLLTGEEPVGVISMGDHEIGDLYVLPRAQGRGYGTMLLRFAMEQCGSARLTVLSSNTRALAWYKRNGFAQTGQRRQLRDGLWEVELEFGELP